MVSIYGLVMVGACTVLAVGAFAFKPLTVRHVVSGRFQSATVGRHILTNGVGASVPHREATIQMATASPPDVDLGLGGRFDDTPDEERTEHLSRVWCDAVATALQDKRRIDEVVGLFKYTGEVHTDNKAYSGQGQVKRFLTDLLLREETKASFEGLCVTSPGRSSMDLHVSRKDGSEATMVLHMEWQNDQVSSLVVHTLKSNTQTLPKQLDGPKWETDDGRVVQKIWQQAGCFDIGNTFLLDKMELTTGRLITVIDQNVWDLYGEKIQAWCDHNDLELDSVIAPGNEDQKTMDNCLFMLDRLKEIDPLRRSEPVLAIGGGVLTDVAGFACALWRRGIPWCRMPTTLLGMVDASVGIKVAVNYHRKNGVGHFFSPTHTIVDSTFLPTVSKPDIRSGVGEIMKAALVHDQRLFDLMEEHGEGLIERNFVDSPVADQVIKFSVDTMLECIGPDLWEESLLRPMDFGHSFSRTLEADESFKLRHGEAVAIDCIMSTMIANVKGLVSDEDASRVLELYAALKLPCSIAGITAETYKRAVREITVHRDGILRAPLPHGIGSCAYVDEITDAEVDQAFSKLSTFMEEHPQVYWDPSKSFSA